MNKIIITLKQHTPLLHFQPMQEGATLRASEVKPKLDNFLLKALGEGDYEEGKKVAGKNGWLIGQSDALNYKLKIESKDKQELELTIPNPNNGKYKTANFPLVLSNMAGKEKKEELVNLVMFEKLILSIVVPNSKIGLYDFLIKPIVLKNSPVSIFGAFFALNNFGQRKSKGFGCFEVIGIKYESEGKGEEEEFNSAYSSIYQTGTKILKFNSSGPIKKVIKSTFETIDFYWKCLKSGVNYQSEDKDKDKGYIKSFLYFYLNENKNCTWEKRIIKQTFRKTTHNDDFEETKVPIFGRALIGLPEKFEYDKGKFVITVSSSTIERIPSPIVFKPFIMKVNKNEYEVKIYVTINQDVVQSIKNNSEEFIFELKLDSRKTGQFRNNGAILRLKADPAKIDYQELIQKYHDHIKANRHLYVGGTSNEDWLNYDDYEDIIRIVPRNYKWIPVLDDNEGVKFFSVKEK